MADSGERGARKTPVVPGSSPVGLISKNLKMLTGRSSRPGVGEGFSDFRVHLGVRALAGGPGRVFLTFNILTCVPLFFAQRSAQTLDGREVAGD